ncbi:T9SS type B sorting domain-containing protein [Hwangdonia lutea]|uniref:T9SS type B sorting domain-containing protein n=1 Tax=Hwangdonia lutea TaxID=3075823 RepID=A0AA97HSZ7_9FLAO|nr:T9SS type B sorting domain-containing protein [Hwangdonia sp. SCSIO 19198]WOD45003.1 T9SS type B sorting domain-containing protein [Hwangdonia sp. SCSIO 19198]
MVNKINFFTLYLFLISSYCISQNTFVPDDNFEQALINLGYDSGALDDFVPTANINTITELYIDALNISDLTGIQDFTALSILDCSENNLSSLPISSNFNLTEIFCNNNALTSLNVSALSLLKILWCDFNQLTAINVTNNTDLISLTCGNNLITSLDVTQNLNLNVLVCENNQIPNIDVTQNSTLNSLLVRGNMLTSLDVTQNPNIAFLDCGINQLTSLDVTQNSNLRVLLCFNNQLTSLDVTQNTLLSDLSCVNNQITQLDMSKNTSLVNLDCSYNDLCWLNIRNGTNENATIMHFDFNPNLTCVVIDDASRTYPNWKPYPFSNFVEQLSDCSSFVPVDTLQNFIGASYTLPVLNNGNYYTQSGGNGTLLQAGDVINSSQTIYIYNETSCDSNESNFTVNITNEDYFIPKYFTPNNDGKHDYWTVTDLNNSINNISIYNRYGQLLKFLLPNSQGWDGVYNGQLLPTDSYWYRITLNNREVLRGYFALKR